MRSWIASLALAACSGGVPPRRMVVWAHTAHIANRVREAGAVFTTLRAMVAPQILPERYDAVIFVDHTTRARPPLERSECRRLPTSSTGTTWSVGDGIAWVPVRKVGRF